MKDFRRRLSGSSLLTWTAIAGMLLGSAISFVATLCGLIDFIESTGTVNDYTGVVAAALTLFIQLTLLVAAIRLRQARWHNKVVYLFTYLVVAFFSVSFATGFWTSAIDGERLAMQSAAEPLAETGDRLMSYRSGYSNVVTAMTDLKDHSVKMAVEEEQFGTSCGYKTPAQKGPRYSLRMEDASFMQANAGIVSTEFSRVDSLLTMFLRVEESFDPKLSSKTQTALRSILNELRQISEAPVLGRVSEYLRERTRTRGLDIERQGAVFNCPDPEFDALASIVESEIQGLPPIPNPSTVELFDAVNSADAVRLIFDKSLGFLSGLVTDLWPKSLDNRREERIAKIQNGPAKEASALKLSTLPVAVGILVDLLILIAAMSTPRRGWLSEADPPIIDKMAGQAIMQFPSAKNLNLIRTLILESLDEGESLYEIIRNAMDDRNRIVVSSDESQKSAKILLKFMDFLCLEEDAEAINKNNWRVKRILKSRNDTDDQEPDRAWLLKKSIRPEKVRLAIMILEAQVRTEVNESDFKHAA